MNYSEKEAKMQRDSFVFYKSFAKAIKALDAENAKALMEAIFDFALEDEEPEIENPLIEAMFELIRPQLEANKKRYENAKKGGRPKTETKPNENQTETKQKPKANQNKTETKPNENQTETKPYPNVNVNDNVNDNENVNEDNKKEKKIYARDEILEEALNKSDVQVMLNDLGVNETFLYELFHYRQSIGKPILNVKMLIKTLNDFKQTKLKTGKDVYELFEIMQSEGWKNITASYVMNSEKARKQNKDNEQEWIEEAQAEIEAFVNS